MPRTTREQRLAMADTRALEEEEERMNPVQPLKKTSRRGRTSLVATAPEYVGAGATPSMGLSQFRGGAREESPSEDLTGGSRIVGAGTKKGMVRKTARKAFEHTPEDMGMALRDHLHSVKGAGFYEDFKKGFTNVSGPGFEAVSGGVRTGRYEGKGKLLIQHLPSGEGEEMVVGSGKKKRKPAGPSDARRKRGALVSKLMKTKGMSLAEASRHIKEMGLM